MQTIEITLLDDRWPRLQCMVRFPDGSVITRTAHYDQAASQFEPDVRRVLQKTVETIINDHLGSGMKR